MRFVTVHTYSKFLPRLASVIIRAYPRKPPGVEANGQEVLRVPEAGVEDKPAQVGDGVGPVRVGVEGAQPGDVRERDGANGVSAAEVRDHLLQSLAGGRVRYHAAENSWSSASRAAILGVR